MSRTKSSAKWLKEHFSDEYVKKAQKMGYRSRAAFKLIEIQEKDRLIKPNMRVIDLGAAPGGWSQIMTKWLGRQGLLISLDILPIQPFENDHNILYIQGDFREQSVFDSILEKLNHEKVDVITSDLAPNTSGMSDVDQPRAMVLAELSLELAIKILKTGGSLVVKVFQGEGYDQFLKELRKHFQKVLIRKPLASRNRSRENYLVAKGFMV
jgi:23S rRNA (uridine2552-2'-O)-methyltransferase